MKKNSKLILLLSTLLIASCSTIVPITSDETGKSINISSSPTISPATTPTASIKSSLSLTGIITDKQTNKGISNLTVELNGRISLTDNDGRFFFDDIVSGKSKLYFTKTGQYNDLREVEINDYSKTVNFIVDVNPVPIIRFTPMPTNSISSIIIPSAQSTIKPSLLTFTTPNTTPTATATVTATPTSTPTATPTATTEPTIKPTLRPTPTPLTEQEIKQQVYNTFAEKKSEVKEKLGAGFFANNPTQHDQNIKESIVKLNGQFNQGSISKANYYQQFQNIYVEDGIYYDRQQIIVEKSSQRVKVEVQDKLNEIYDNYAFYYRLEYVI